jgi:hypothetical protein
MQGKRGNSGVQFQVVPAVGEVFNKPALDVDGFAHVKGLVVGGVNQGIHGVSHRFTSARNRTPSPRT